MKLKMLVVDLEIPWRVKRWALRIGIPVTVLLGGGALAYGSGLTTWSSGETLQAADLNDNFGYLQGEISALQSAPAPSAFAGPLNFSGATSLDFPAPGFGSGAVVTFGGLDLFNAAMTGTYPAVIGSGEAYETSTAGFSCGAPSQIDFDIPIGTAASEGIANGAFGHVTFTKGGAFNLSQGSSTQPNTPLGGTEGCANLCYGPVTFFLNNPGAAQSILLQGWMDDGPSPIYVNGAVAVPNATSNMLGSGQQVSIPAGPFSLSFEACSSNGDSLAFFVTTQWITQYGLTVNYDQTFHRNGK